MTPTKALPQESIGALLEQIRSLDPVDTREEESRALILALLPTMEDPFNEQRGALHVTASALLAHRQGTVLHKHRRLGIWLQPGGHIEDGETPPSAALRECKEETGLDASFFPGQEGIFHVDVHPGPRGHRHLDLRYLLLVDELAIKPQAGESEEVEAFSWEAALTIADPGLQGALRRAALRVEGLWQGGV